MRVAFELLKVACEPSGASALAAALARPPELAGRRVAVTLTGANVSHDDFAALTAMSDCS